jgi:hypothetical protein
LGLVAAIANGCLITALVLMVDQPLTCAALASFFGLGARWAHGRFFVVKTSRICNPKKCEKCC